MSNIIEHTQKTLDKLLEEISQHSEGQCPFCSAEDFPVKGKKVGYENVTPEEAEEWQLEHFDDCPVLVIERARQAIAEAERMA